MVSCSPDSNYIFLSCNDCVLLQYNRKEEFGVHKYKFEGRVASFQVDDMNILYVITMAGEFRIFDLETTTMIGELPRYGN